MSSNDSASGVPPVRESRSLHNIFSGFFFNHVDHTRAVAGSTPPFREGVEMEGPRNDSGALALVFGTQVEVDDFKLLETSGDVTSAGNRPPLRRSTTWTSSLQNSDPIPHPLPLPQPPSSAPPLPTVQSPSGIISFKAPPTGNDVYATGSGLRALRKSLSDIFSSSDRVIIERGRSQSLIPTSTDDPVTPDAVGHDPVTFVTPAVLSRPRHSLPTIHDNSPPPSDDFPPPTSPKSKSLIRRESALPSVAEVESLSRIQSIQNIREVDSQVVEKRKDLVDVNHNVSTASETGSTTSTTCQEHHGSSGGEPQSPGMRDLAQPEAMKVPEVKPRMLGILERFASTEKRKVRNKDMNVMAPQSW